MPRKLILASAFLAACVWLFAGNIKTVDGVARANIKTLDGVASANLKTINGVDSTTVATPTSPVIVYPTGDSSTDNNWDALGAGSKYVEVDDIVGAPDDATSYVTESDVNASTQLFTHGGINVGTAADYTVIVHTRMRDNNVSVGLKERIKIGGTVYANPGSSSPTASFADYSYSFTLNPATAAEWTEAEVESIQEFGFGTTSMSAGETIDVTQCYLEITW